MAIALDATSGTWNTTGTTRTVAHTCTGSDRALVACVTGQTTDVITDCSYAGVSMTLVGKVAASGGRWTYLFYLSAPATGANNLVATSSTSGYIEVIGTSYTGVSQTGQPEAFATGSSTSATTQALAVTTVSDNAFAVMAATLQGGTITAGASTTLRKTSLVGAVLDSGSAVTPAGARTLTANAAGAANFTAAVVASLAPVSAPVESLTITTPAAYEVHQRSGSTGSIQISGSITGSTEDIEASFNGGSYATIASAVSGSFSGTLTAQAQGQGTLTVRKKTTTTTSATVANVGIGDVFVVGGDSISEGRGTNAQSYTHATLKAAKFTQADTWGEGNDGIDTGTNVGSHWPLLATQIMASQGVPVAFISCGAGSTDVAGSHNEWAKPNSGYSELTAQVTASTAATVKGVLLHLGPNAVINASTLSLATYNAALDTLASNIAADVAGAPKINVGIFGETSTGSPPDRAAALNNLRGAIIQAHNDNANIKPGPCLIDLDYTEDGVHPKSDAALQAVAARWWVALSETYYSGSGGRGPRLSSANWNGARNALTVVFDRTLKTGLTHATACWSVSDNGTPMTVSSIAYHGSNAAALVLTMSAAATGGAGTTTVSFAAGDTAVGLVVPLSTDITMPAGAAVQIPAEPIYSAAVGEVDDLAPTLSGASGTATGQTTGAGAVSTTEGNGTLYRLASTNASETAATIKAAALTQAVSASGAQAVSFSGLTAGTAYYAHFVHTDAAGNESDPISSAASFTTDAPAATSVTLTLTTDGTTPAASLTGLEWAFFDQTSPGSFLAPTAKGTIESTDGSGVLALDITGTALTVGQTGWLIVSDSDGTTTQSPAAKAFSGPVVVA